MAPRSTIVVAAVVCAATVAGAVPAAATPGQATGAAVPTGQQQALADARRLLAGTEADLHSAVTTARQVRLAAASGTLSSAWPDQAARRPSDPPTLRLVAEVVDSGDPVGRLGLARLTAPVAVAPRPVRPRTPAQAVALAVQHVRTAQADHASARALVRQLQDPGSVGTPGAARLVRECAEAAATGGVCRPVPWGEHHLVFDSVVIERVVGATWPQVTDVGGWRPYDAYPDHPSGRAVDIMMPRRGRGYDNELGDEIARYFQQHAKEFGIHYMIWRQRQWKAGSRVGDWYHMSDRGDPTANHMDHVHITVHGNRATAFQRLLVEAAPAPA